MNKVLDMLKLLPNDFEFKPLKTREKWKKMEEDTLALAKKILEERRSAKIEQEDNITIN